VKGILGMEEIMIGIGTQLQAWASRYLAIVRSMHI